MRRFGWSCRAGRRPQSFFAGSRATAAVVVVFVVVLVAGLAGCGAPHPTLSRGAVSACYRAIPTATEALHDPKAKLLSVHRVPVDQLERRLADIAQLKGDSDTEVCALIFSGTFRPGQVSLAPPTDQGRYAVILVTSRHLDLLASFVVATLPRSLGRRLI